MPDQNICLWGWDAAAGAWVKLAVTAAGLVRVDMAAVSLNDLGDVNVPAPAAWDILHWNNVAGEWQGRLLSNWTLAELGAKNLNDLDDVNAPAPADNEALTWDLGTARWIAELAEPAVHGAAKHTDVVRSKFFPAGPYTTGAFGLWGKHTGPRLDPGLTEGAYVEFMTPDEQTGVGISLKVVWMGITGGTPGFDWVCDPSYQAGADGQARNTHSSAPANTTLDVPAADRIIVSDVSLNAAPLLKGDYVGAEFRRVGADVADTWETDIMILGALYTYTAEQ